VVAGDGFHQAGVGEHPPKGTQQKPYMEKESCFKGFTKNRVKYSSG